MIRSSLLLLSLPLAAAFAQSAPIHVLISAPNGFLMSIPSTDSGRGPIIGRGRLEYSAEAQEVRVTSTDSLKSVHVDATENGRVIASGDGAYVVVHREATGVVIEARSQIPPPITHELRKPVAPELRKPIEQLQTAIESRLTSRMEEAYSRYEQDDRTKHYFEALLDRADSVHVTSIEFQTWNVTRNVAQVNYRMIISYKLNQSRIPIEVASSWRADLVRPGPKEPWQIVHLTRHAVM